MVGGCACVHELQMRKESSAVRRQKHEDAGGDKAEQGDCKLSLAELRTEIREAGGEPGGDSTLTFSCVTSRHVTSRHAASRRVALRCVALRCFFFSPCSPGGRDLTRQPATPAAAHSVPEKQ